MSDEAQRTGEDAATESSEVDAVAETLPLKSTDTTVDTHEEDGLGDDSFAQLLKRVAAAPSAPVFRDAPALCDGQTLGGYRIVSVLGRGGMGMVYRALDERLQRPAAIKVIRRDALVDREAVERFLHEARVTARFSHPNIVTVYGVGEVVEGSYYVALELVAGTPLDDRLASPEPLDTTASVAIGRGVARALAEAHQHGVLHRDLKPGNIVLGQDGRARVLDFGLAKLVATGADDDVTASEISAASTSSRFETRQGAIRGTPAYMAPEQWRGQASPAVDIWALGLVLYELFSGRHPLDKNSSPMIAVCGPQPMPDLAELRPDLDPELTGLVGRCLDKDPEQRPSASEVAELLDEFVVGGRSPTVPEHARKPPPPPLWRSALWFALVAPLLWAPWQIHRSPSADVASAFGLSQVSPWMSLVATLLVFAGLGAVAVSGYADWAHKGPRWLRWIGSPWTAAVPVVGLGLILWHTLTVGGQSEAHFQPFLRYNAVSTRQAAELVELIASSIFEFLNAATIVLLLVAAVSVVALLSGLFRRRVGSSAPRIMWATVVAGIAIIVTTEVVLASTVSFYGVWRFVVYLSWFVTVVAVFRHLGYRPWATRTLVAGLGLTTALVGLAVSLGFLQIFGRLWERSGQESPYLFVHVVMPALIHGAIALLVLTLVLYALLGLVVRTKLSTATVGLGLAQWVVHITGIVAAAIPIYLLLSTMSSAENLWLGQHLATMTPVGADPSEPTVYLDARPRTLAAGKRAHYLALSALSTDYSDERLLEVVTDSTECRRSLLASLSGREPARCLSGEQAQLHCQSLGLRLPTRGELTLMDHDTEWVLDGVAVVASDHGDDVGFRCAYSFVD